jgi:hypothetical protein
MIVKPESALSDVGAYWESLGGVWGGRNRDPIHFEYPGFKTDYGSAIQETATADAYSGTTLESIKDLVATLPVPFTVEAVAMLSQYLGSESDILEALTNPSKAVRKHPWLRYLGAPFIFY